MSHKFSKSDDDFQTSSAPKITNKLNVVKPIFFNFNKNRFERLSRNKTKCSKIVNEYQASQIPNNKGSSMSIDDLVNFINGINSCHISKKESKSNHNVITSVKKHAFIRNDERKETSSSIIEKYDTSYEVQMKTSVNDVTHNVVNEECYDGRDKIRIYNDFSLEEDDSFFKVVRRKKRHRPLNDNKHYFVTTNNPTDEHINDVTIERHLPIQNKLVNVNDKESLNLFIKELWIDFRSCYQEYLQRQSQETIQ